MLVSNHELEYYYKSIFFGDIDEIKKDLKNIYENNENVLATMCQILDGENKVLDEIKWCKEIFFTIIEQKNKTLKPVYRIIKKHGNVIYVTIYEEGEWSLQQNNIDSFFKHIRCSGPTSLVLHRDEDGFEYSIF